MDPSDINTIGGAGAGSALATAVALVLYRLLKPEEKGVHDMREALGRIESKQNDIEKSQTRVEERQNALHTDLHFVGNRVGALEKTIEHLDERINKGLDHHRQKLEVLTERMVRVETKIEGDE